MLLYTIIHQTINPMEFWRSRSLGDLDQRSHVSCLSTFSKGFSPETTGSISFNFHMQPPSKEGKNVYIFGLGHITMVAASPVYSKNIEKSFSLKPLGRLPCDLE